MIWFDKWPNEALNSVAFRELQSQEQLGIGYYKTVLAKSMVDMNNQIVEVAEIYS